MCPPIVFAMSTEVNKPRSCGQAAEQEREREIEREREREEG
jgi:hypothetical protein